ncbi:DinB family protein [Pollutibacter soli]|uniref:DinB family protein n=1 Tax=Pollutibacter soli TaxID=3034157 RepID=UPI003013A877
MQLQQAVRNVFTQLTVSLDQLSAEQYKFSCAQLGNSTIGQHVRHIIEMFQCLENGYTTGVINYEIRKRDQKIEQDKGFAMQLLQEIHDSLAKEDKALILEGVYNDDSSDLMRFPTNYYREIVYNLEHTIHHMALIRVGLRSFKEIEVPETYGVAAATVKHNKSCAQ